MDGRNTELAVSIKNKVEHLPTPSTNCCIYPVPECLRRMNEAAYRPFVVSIGPFYHKDKTLCFMEKHKLRYLDTFMKSLIDGRTLENCVQIIREKEVEIRGHYMQSFELCSEEFIEMVLVDGVFVIELFRRLDNRALIEENDDPLYGRQKLILEVYRDLRLLENQLPFFILKTLYNFVFGVPSFFNITCKFFYISAVEEFEFKHFVDLLRTSHLPSLLRSSSNKGSVFGTTISATYLYSAGVKFVKCKKKSLLDIEFDPDRQSLKMSPLKLDDLTEPFFRSLLVFEQFHYPDDSYIIDYMNFLSKLISTPNDVGILVRCGVIDNLLGNNEEALNFFNTISKHVKIIDDNFYYSDVCKKLDKCRNEYWPRNIAILKQEYFNHPWAILAVISAVVILILTFVQAVTGVISSKKG